MRTPSWVVGVAESLNLPQKVGHVDSSPATNHGSLIGKVGNYYGRWVSSTGISKERYANLPTRNHRNNVENWREKPINE